MKILLTNDDGIEAKGIRTLWEVLKDFATVFMVAPATQQSGKGASISLRQIVKVTPVNQFPQTRAWKVAGTPADCVKIALSDLLDFVPDFIVSGINHGSNAGRNIFYSGTTGAVIEGALRDIPGIAFSHVSFFDTMNLSHMKPFILSILKHLVSYPLTKGTFLNVTFPDLSTEKPKGFKLARQGRSHWLEILQKTNYSDGSMEYLLNGKNSNPQEDEESDVALIKKGYITAVPIHIQELTDHTQFKEKQLLFETKLNKIFNS